jgi:hypothetical protein
MTDNIIDITHQLPAQLPICSVVGVYVTAAIQASLAAGATPELIAAILLSSAHGGFEEAGLPPDANYVHKPEYQEQLVDVKTLGDIKVDCRTASCASTGKVQICPVAAVRHLRRRLRPAARLAAVGLSQAAPCTRGADVGRGLKLRALNICSAPAWSNPGR